MSTNDSLAWETSGLFLGAMPPQEFLDKFLPISKDIRVPVEFNDFYDFMGSIRCATIRENRPCFCTCLWLTNIRQIAAVGKFAPHLKFIDTSKHPDTECDTLSPDISIYPLDDLPEKGAKTVFSKMGLFVELEPNDNDDPFLDPTNPSQDFLFEKDSKDARLVRGRLASYAAALMESQFRVHSFSVLVCKNHARFIRWDRDGAIVTRRFDYGKHDFLADFFWRYSRLERDLQGYDPSFLPKTTKDIDIPETDSNRLKEGNPECHHEFRILMVPDRHSPENEKEFVVSFPPKYTARSPFGRAVKSLWVGSDLKDVPL